ncbi:MAG: hypothetical protein HQL51_13600 [Magnetococcales bacterium]|nr:hypothetical protein [Magnetococcales bacterium]
MNPTCTAFNTTPEYEKNKGSHPAPASLTLTLSQGERGRLDDVLSR